jgi:hypothetical protein
MRTTLTLDDDVAARIARLQAARKVSLKEIVNEALRRGLERMDAPRERRRSYRTRPADLGRCLAAGGLDDVGEALALADGEAFR